MYFSKIKPVSGFKFIHETQISEIKRIEIFKSNNPDPDSSGEIIIDRLLGRNSEVLGYLRVFIYQINKSLHQ